MFTFILIPALSVVVFHLTIIVGKDYAYLLIMTIIYLGFINIFFHGKIIIGKTCYECVFHKLKKYRNRENRLYILVCFDERLVEFQFLEEYLEEGSDKKNVEFHNLRRSDSFANYEIFKKLPRDKNMNGYS